MSHAISNTQAPVLKAHGSILHTGITNGKIGMWLFLASEVMFFTGLIGAYIVLRAGNLDWPAPTDDGYPLNVPLTAINTFFLICSSVTLVAGLQGYQADNIRKGNWFMLATTVIGAMFVGIQVVEYFELVHGGTLPSSDLFGSCFFTMTGFHGFHVFLGVVAIGVLTAMGFAGKFNAKNNAVVELVGLYWHFVDLVWIILFPIVYLM